MLDDARPPLNKARGFLELRLCRPASIQHEHDQSCRSDCIALNGPPVMVILRDMNLDLRRGNSGEKLDIRRPTRRKLSNVNNLVVIRFGETVQCPG